MSRPRVTMRPSYSSGRSQEKGYTQVLWLDGVEKSTLKKLAP